MNRPLIGYIFIITAIAIAVSSLFYIKHTHKTMDEKLDIVLDSAIKDDKSAVKRNIEKVLSEWENKVDILNIILGQGETNDIKNPLNMAYKFSLLGDTESVILYITECKTHLERIENTNQPSLSTIL